ncbi:pyrimidine-nucleoside phosphorylase [Paramaledivibacter caminithermalis]|jgi:pyrimidine-nucleoside phosphorylase/thymidine phosphorylase|uniref:Pyrimidine-nucleoside phosphorylase n=1 Tax=Paramaledivibacter caminithermalis (strain DSM 15212 / CIP 107654 / DViRD3) TaxID=1121301 RepID=A0A1M6PHG0_PARC5|nr:pyrimidine-nucleoside phosphorylase [Paramaledivibacter caminithermalis]SHK07389.1 pyrimidine-nucleoside phosphorylase [Paramaledivibacter caminithermalis DSM 15212]
MRMIDIIQKKKNGETLSTKEINFMIEGYTKGEIPDYQMSAFSMAVYFKGMNKQEIADLTMAMVNSGEKIDLSAIKGIKVDKHSTGGVGDKISLIVVPLVASVGIPVAKLSGRGLGHTGGTIDKLESIEGFNIEMGTKEFIDNVNKYKMAIAGQTANLTPADKKLYALRDVTSTVDSIPLIASSIMSKKIASGADAIVLDVKVGSGAFMKNLDEARELAKTMVEIGKSLNKRTVAVISNMNQPLGYEVGNANEVKEAIKVLSGEGAEDETVVALTIASYMTVLGGAFEDFNIAYKELEKIIKSGKAIDKLKELIRIQGGNPDVISNTDMLPKAKYHIEVKALKNGYVEAINAEQIGIIAMLLGAGRKTKKDKIDYSAGVTIVKKVGDEVKLNDTICILHTNKESYNEAKKLALEAFKISKNKPEKIEYIYDVFQ